MQVGLTQNELLNLIALKADDLSSMIRDAQHGLIAGDINLKKIDEMVSRIAALTTSLFEPPATPSGLGSNQVSAQGGIG